MQIVAWCGVWEVCNVVLLFGGDMHNALDLLMLGFQLRDIYLTPRLMILIHFGDVPAFQLKVLSMFGILWMWKMFN